MKVLLLILLALNPIDDIKKIAQVNTLKEEARKAYHEGDFDKAKNTYALLVDSMGINEDELRLNLANSYFNLKDNENAGTQYQQLSDSENLAIKSAALQQLGVMANREGKFKEALELFKQSIKADPKNDDARFNYEMLKKKLKEQENQEKEDQEKDDQQQNQKDKNEDQKDKDQQNQDKQDQEDKEKQDQEKDDQQKQDKDQQNKENKDREGESDEEQDQKQDEIPPSTADKLKDMKISEDKARMLLEAMKNQEIQYLQQNKRKATQRKDPSKPDW